MVGNGAEVRLPAAGETVGVEVLRTDGSSTTRIHMSETGEIAVKREAKPAEGDAKAVGELERSSSSSTTALPGNAASAASAGCGRTGSVATHAGRFSDRTYHWLYNSTHQPDSGAFSAIKLGMGFMTADSSPCGKAATSAQTSYAGSTKLATYGTRDNHNVVGWATFGSSGVLAMSYWYLSGSTVVEADIAFNEKMPWTTSPAGTVASNRYDVISVAAHETGHVLGLDHAQNDEAAVMAPTFRMGENRRTKRSGDLAAMHAAYPQ